MPILVERLEDPFAWESNIMRAQVRVALCLAAAVLLVPGAGLCLGQAIEAVARPSRDVTLSFLRPGRIKAVLVKEGDLVEPGQTLVQLDDEAEQAQLKQLKAQAEDTIHVRAAAAQLEQANVDLRMKEWAYERNAVPKMELEHAQLEAKIKQLSLELARFENDLNQLKYLEAKVRVNQMQVVSPIAGRVEKIMLREGESADGVEDIIRVVKTDPLWVDVPVPVGQVRAMKLALGGKAEVAFPIAGEGQENRTVMGKIIHIAAMADSASETKTVRVEVPYEGSAPAGERVKVSFQAPAGSGGAMEKAEVPLSKKPPGRKE
jgi:RND family efflux transporter MFP subunit